VPHPAIGVRIPSIFASGILSAYKMRRTAGGLMLSCTREAAPKYVIDSSPGKYASTLGHTGMSISDYILKSSEMASRRNVLVEIESDHLIVGSYLQAVQRILGGTGDVEMTDEEVSSSLSFVYDAIDEAISTGLVNAFTVDTTSLVDLKVEECSKEELTSRFNSEFPGSKSLLEEYSHQFHSSWIDGSLHTVRFSEEDTMRMAVQFKRSLETCSKIYSHIRERMEGKPFGFELTLDELPKQTGRELLYYLREWRKMGGHADFVAPSIGFRKRADFQGDLRVLRQQLSFLAALAYGCGALLSIHSGSGESPYSGKGEGVYRAILEATGGRVKYKISGVYFELLMDLLAKSKVARHRRLFEKIFDDVSNFWEDQINWNTPLADHTVRNMFSSYKKGLKAKPTMLRSSRSDFFRHYSFIALNLRDKAGKRYLKDELLTLYENDSRLRRVVEKEVKRLTLRLIDGMNFANNLSQIQARNSEVRS
jgi:hypothetical protein